MDCHSVCSKNRCLFRNVVSVEIDISGKNRRMDFSDDFYRIAYGGFVPCQRHYLFPQHSVCREGNAVVVRREGVILAAMHGDVDPENGIIRGGECVVFDGAEKDRGVIGRGTWSMAVEFRRIGTEEDWCVCAGRQHPLRPVSFER